MLAYSTLSQLAYMVAGLSLGPEGVTAGFFHLFTHAFFKALLFLGAGSVIHAVHSNNMSDMGGLRKDMPVTFWTFLIGSAALAGVFPLAGFWSKDELLVGSFETKPWLFFVLLAGRGADRFYMTRCVLLTFFGTYRGDAHPHESPRDDDRPARGARGRDALRRIPRSPAARRRVRRLGLLRAPPRGRLRVLGGVRGDLGRGGGDPGSGTSSTESAASGTR